MDSWKNLRRRMEKALELFNLEEALSLLDVLITSASSPSDVATLLSNHTLRRLPTLHYLTGFPFREEDLLHLERLIRIFTDFGYDINKTLPRGVRRLVSHVTALLASVKKGNVILVECLLRYDAKADMRDPEGLTPCHWAIKTGNLKCLQLLLEHGGRALVKSAPVKNKVLPLLHEAVYNGRLEIVRYLLSKEEELGVNVNEEAPHEVAQEVGVPCTPLRIALDMEATPIIQVLMKHPAAKPSRFQELHLYLSDGLTKEALPLLEYFSDEELSTDKIEDQWALHTMDPSAFVERCSVEYTKELILEYVRRGWDPDSVSCGPKWIDFDDNEEREMDITNYTLFHLACVYKGSEIIKLLVENFRVNIDRKLDGLEQVELPPLLILLNSCEFKDAKYLIEQGADLNVRGNLGNMWIASDPQGSRIMRRNLTTGNLELTSSLNPVEFLLGMGNEIALPLVDQVLSRSDVIVEGAFEFHMALLGRNPAYVFKVLERCADMISKEDLNWVTLWNKNGGEPEKVPCLVWLFQDIVHELAMVDVGALADLVMHMAQLGYDLNSVRDPHQSFKSGMDLLIFYILRYDLEHQTFNGLLRTVLQFDHLQLNVTDVQGLNPVEHLMYEWDHSCDDSREVSMCLKCRDLQTPPMLETVKLLLAHGLDVSGMAIGPNFTYHRGFNLILKMLYRFGAKISEEFFTNPHICFRGTDDRDALAREIMELNEWKDEFDRETGLSLKRISGLSVRKILKCVGDLKTLDELPRGLKEAVLGPTVLVEVGEDELSESDESA